MAQASKCDVERSIWDKTISLAKVLYQYALWYREMEKSFPMEQILGMLYEGYEGENLFMVNVVWCNQHYK